MRNLAEVRRQVKGALCLHEHRCSRWSGRMCYPDRLEGTQGQSNHGLLMFGQLFIRFSEVKKLWHAWLPRSCCTHILLWVVHYLFRMRLIPKPGCWWLTDIWVNRAHSNCEYATFRSGSSCPTYNCQVTLRPISSSSSERPEDTSRTPIHRKENKRNILLTNRLASPTVSTKQCRTVSTDAQAFKLTLFFLYPNLYFPVDMISPRWQCVFCLTELSIYLLPMWEAGANGIAASCAHVHDFLPWLLNINIQNADR